MIQIESIKAFFLAHLLLPTVLLVLVFPLAYLQKKMPFIKSKEVIFYVLFSGLILALPGLLGFSGNTFNPYWYLLASLLYFLFGLIHVNQLSKRFRGQDVPLRLSKAFEIILTVFILLLGVYLFTYIFDWLSPFKGYAYLSARSSVAYLIPLFFYYSYMQFLQIPYSIYKTWNYEVNKPVIDFDGVDLKQLRVVTLELAKNVQDGNQFRIKAKTLTTGVTFGDWFQKVLEDYNFKNGMNTIELQQEDGTYYHWIFYTKRSFFHLRKYVDFELDIAQNKIRENEVISCRRVVENEQKMNELL